VYWNEPSRSKRSVTSTPAFNASWVRSSSFRGAMPVASMRSAEKRTLERSVACEMAKLVVRLLPVWKYSLTFMGEGSQGCGTPFDHHWG